MKNRLVIIRTCVILPLCFPIAVNIYTKAKRVNHNYGPRNERDMSEHKSKRIKKTDSPRQAARKRRAKQPKRSKSKAGRAGEYVGALLELHKLQGVLLVSLRDEVD